MLFETFHMLKDFAAAHPERFHEITEKEFRQEISRPFLPSKEGEQNEVSSLSDKRLHNRYLFDAGALQVTGHR